MVYFLTHGQDLILRMAGAAVASFLVVLLLGPATIRFLIRRKVGDRPEFDHADLNQLTSHKSKTPTMGGSLIVIAILVATILFANVNNSYIRIAMFAMLWLGCVGGFDDWIKLRRVPGQPGRDGLKMWEKLVFQFGAAVLVAITTWHYGRASVTDDGVNPAHSLYLPFLADPIGMSMFAYIVMVSLTMVGSSNAVNITDGMDGLASGCIVIVAIVLLLVAEVVGVRAWAAFFRMPLVAGAGEMSILCAAIIGSCLGFLWYNAHPAQVFMGDTGSLALGGLMGYIAVVIRQELLLLIAGGVFVMEAGSVLMQVFYFKFTRPRGTTLPGKRLFRVAPIHHHFHLGGWAESKVVVRFWLLTVIFAALALATLKLR